MARHDFYEPCRIVQESYVADGMGGQTWTETAGESFLAGFILDTSKQATVADRASVKAAFVIQTDLDVKLRQNDVLLRERDGRKYRVTGNAGDMTTPEIAMEQFREVTAEVIT